MTLLDMFQQIQMGPGITPLRVGSKGIGVAIHKKPLAKDYPMTIEIVHMLDLTPDVFLTRDSHNLTLRTKKYDLFPNQQEKHFNTSKGCLDYLDSLGIKLEEEIKQKLLKIKTYHKDGYLKIIDEKGN
jgi:hypothetical protein